MATPDSRHIGAVAACMLLLSGCGVGSDGNWSGKGCTTSGPVTVCTVEIAGKTCQMVKVRRFMGGDRERTDCKIRTWRHA